MTQDKRSGNVTETDVLIIGTGFAGLCAAIKLREAGVTNIRLVEKNADLGGTWYLNTYPGATCDVASHFYSFSFAPKSDWSHLYSPQPEILAYLNDVADRYELRPLITFGREVTGLRFDPARGSWEVRFADGPPVFARFVVNGMGGLHHPMWPDIDGLRDFAGPVIHTAEWDHTFDPAGKRIAVIGSAASAIQVVPELARKAARLDVWQRTPNHIVPRGNYAYSDRQKALFARFPVLRRLYRWKLKTRMDWLLYPLIRFPLWRARLAGQFEYYRSRAIPDPEMRARLTPDYELGCKRILVSDDFYAALKRQNVFLVTDQIARITPEGIEDTSGRLRAVDAIICATGFDIQKQFTAIEVEGPRARLADVWADKVEAWRGVMVAGFPNLFFVTGPNTGVGTTSVVHMIEQAVGWIVQAIAEVPTGGTIDVDPGAQDRRNAALHAALGRTVWATDCQSWYKRADGRIETLYPGNAAAYAREMRHLRRGELILKGPE